MEAYPEQPWRPLVNMENLGRWMDEQGLPAGEIEDIQALTGGTQNLLLRFRRAGHGYVLRRPPAHAAATSSNTMRRESRMLGALAGTDVPHPQLLAACGDETVLGAAFYLMAPVDGFNAAVGLPPLHAGDPAIRRQMGFALIDGLAKLGAVDYLALGLGDLGKIDGFLERQVGRWHGQLESYASFAGWPGPAALIALDRAALWLEANRPREFLPGIMHGDFHIVNAMYRYDGPELAAIIDWEMTTIGDPLIDLGWMLAMWPDSEADAQDAPVQPWTGFPSAEEMIAHYAKQTARDLSAISWYRAFACYKLGIVLEGTYARACAGKAPPETGERLHGLAVNLIARVHKIIARAGGY